MTILTLIYLLIGVCVTALCHKHFGTPRRPLGCLFVIVWLPIAIYIITQELYFGFKHADQ